MAIGSWPEAAAVFPNLLSTHAVVESTPNALADEIELIEGDLGATGGTQAANVSRISFLRNHRYDCEASPSSTTAITIEAGELAVENGAGSIIMMKRNTSQISITAANLDSGVAFQVSSTYNIFAKGDLTSTTFWGVVSTAAIPSNITYYKKIGHFTTDGSSNILGVGNIKQSGLPFWTTLWTAILSVATASSASTPFTFPTYGSNDYSAFVQFSTTNSGDGATVNHFSMNSSTADPNVIIYHMTATGLYVQTRETPKYLTDAGAPTDSAATHYLRLIIR